MRVGYFDAAAAWVCASNRGSHTSTSSETHTRSPTLTLFHSDWYLLNLMNLQARPPAPQMCAEAGVGRRCTRRARWVGDKRIGGQSGRVDSRLRKNDAAELSPLLARGLRVVHRAVAQEPQHQLIAEAITRNFTKSILDQSPTFRCAVSALQILSARVLP
jgi:hypothetical protein